MPKRIYVGNLPFSATEVEIEKMFKAYGQVAAVDIVIDRTTGRPRGFAFVDMETGAADAIEALHQTEMGGRSLNVNEARPRRG